eukprot:scaffold2911_cov414-Prasinococcus_capsulatus_cf.AAC.6
MLSNSSSHTTTISPTSGSELSVCRLCAQMGFPINIKYCLGILAPILVPLPPLRRTTLTLPSATRTSLAQTVTAGDGDRARIDRHRCKAQRDASEAELVCSEGILVAEEGPLPTDAKAGAGRRLLGSARSVVARRSARLAAACMLCANEL